MPRSAGGETSWIAYPDHIHAIAAVADHEHALAWLYPRAVPRRPDPRRRAARNEPREVERKIAIDHNVAKGSPVDPGSRRGLPSIAVLAWSNVG